MTTIDLSIFHTNDLHGHLDAMARLSAFARRLRSEAQAEGRRVFFWDAGDAADRRVRIVSLTKGAAFSPILNAMGYTLQTLGNDIALTYGPQAMAAVAARANFPILAANCRDGAGPLVEGLHEYALVPLSSNLTMGVIGLTSPWGGMYEIFGLRFPDLFDLTRRLVTRLKSQNISPIVVLSHLGLDDDRRLAQEVAGIDLIVGAHSHHLLPEGEERNRVLIAQAGEYAEALGRIDVTLDAETGRVIKRAARVLDVPAHEPPDPIVLNAIALVEQEVRALTAQPIGELVAPLNLDYFHECGIGNLAADALREHFDADAALIASGLFHQGLPSGTITFGQLDAACFTTANPCLTELRGSHLLAALERGLDPAISEQKHKWLRGTAMGIPQISGMVVEYDPAADVGSRIKRVTIGGDPLAADRLYRVAHTDAETIPEHGYLILDEGQKTQSEVPTIVRQVIEPYLRRHAPVPKPLPGRWRAVAQKELLSKIGT